jgi:hypothetical protein
MAPGVQRSATPPDHVRGSGPGRPPAALHVNSHCRPLPIPSQTSPSGIVHPDRRSSGRSREPPRRTARRLSARPGRRPPNADRGCLHRVELRRRPRSARQAARRDSKGPGQRHAGRIRQGFPFAEHPGKERPPGSGNRTMPAPHGSVQIASLATVAPGLRSVFAVSPARQATACGRVRRDDHSHALHRANELPVPIRDDGPV